MIFQHSKELRSLKWGVGTLNFVDSWARSLENIFPHSKWTITLQEPYYISPPSDRKYQVTFARKDSMCAPCLTRNQKIWTIFCRMSRLTLKMDVHSSLWLHLKFEYFFCLFFRFFSIFIQKSKKNRKKKFKLQIEP